MAVVAMALIASPAMAKVVMVNAILDLTAATERYPGLGWYELTTFTAPVTIAEGDTIDITLTFLGDQRVSITQDPEKNYAFAFARLRGAYDAYPAYDGPSVYWSTMTELLDLQGPARAISSYAYTGYGGGTSVAAVSGAAFFFIDGAATASFSGFHTVLDVLSLAEYSSGGPTTFDASMIDFNFGLDTLGVPEPSAWALMMLGVGAAGATLRRTRRHSVLGAPKSYR